VLHGSLRIGVERPSDRLAHILESTNTRLHPRTAYDSYEHQTFQMVVTFLAARNVKRAIGLYRRHLLLALVLAMQPFALFTDGIA